MGKRKIAYVSPGKYIQATDIMDELPYYTAQYGSAPFILIDSFFWDSCHVMLQELHIKENRRCLLRCFGGENSSDEIKKCCETAREHNADYVIAIGGGKALDCGKYISHLLGMPFVSMPTTAATDAPCSALSIVYDSSENNRKVIQCNNNPSLVLVDNAIIANAPIRFLKAGIGDALATYFEAMANERSGSSTFAGEGYIRTRLSISVAKTCYDILKKYAKSAVMDAERHKVTQALEYVIEANILLSGLGFENTGCAGAHSISGGLGAVEECKGIMHGEKVAFGTLCQVYIERQGEAILNDLFELCYELDLPITLKDLGINSRREEKAAMIAEASMDKFWNAEPMEITIEDIKKAILAVDVLGSRFKKNK